MTAENVEAASKHATKENAVKAYDGAVYLDGKADGAGPFGKVKTAEILFKFKCNEWVNTVQFSPSGNQIVFASKFDGIYLFSSRLMSSFYLNYARKRDDINKTKGWTKSSI